VFGASFIRLTSTPHRYGQNWAEELNLQFAGIPAAKVRAALAAQPGVTGYAAGDYGQVSIGGQAIPAIGLDPLRGRGFLTLLAGRAPATGAEIALGEGTLRSLHLRLGQRVPVGTGHGARPMRIVGVATFARFSQASSAATDLGTGAVVPAPMLSLPSPPTCAGHVTCYNFVLIRYRHGTSLRAAAARLAATVTRAGCPPGICLLTADQRPGEIRNYSGVRETPLALGLVLVALAVGTLAQVLLTSVRRRRRDLAVLKTLGLSRRQVQAVVTWQAVAGAGAALALGLPLGVVAGRWSWAVFAGSAGVAGDASVPPPLLLLAVPAALLAAVVIAAARLGGGPDQAGRDPSGGVTGGSRAGRSPWTHGVPDGSRAGLASGRDHHTLRPALAGPGGGRRDHALVCWQTAFARVATGTSACLRDGRRQRLMVRVS
jgi:FtsX-like permease family